MTREDVIKIMSVLRGAYPQFYRDISKQEALDTINLWAEMLRDDSPQMVAAAVKALIASDEKGFPPHIGAVKARLRQITEKPQMTAAEAWGLVLSAVKRSAYDSREEFEKLPAMLQRLVGSPSQLRDWAMMDAETVQSVVASNFQRSYQVRAKQEQEYQALPSKIKQMIGSIADRFALEDGGENR